MLEDGVDVVGGEDDAAQVALGQQVGHRLPVGGRGVGVRERGFEDDVHVGLGRGAEGHPAHVLVPDVAPDLHAEQVPVEGERPVVVVDGYEALREVDVHARHATVGGAGVASPFLTGSPVVNCSFLACSPFLTGRV